MCRYGMSGPYKRHFACFVCRKAFKRAPLGLRYEQPPDAAKLVGDPAPCPDCGRPMADMGLDFQAPARTAVEHWEVVACLFRHRIAYHSCGCGGPGYRPSRRADVPAFLASQYRATPGAALAARFATRRAGR